MNPDTKNTKGFSILVPPRKNPKKSWKTGKLPRWVKLNWDRDGRWRYAA